MKQIVLCATQRSGSTMIVEDMRNTGKLGRAEEYFIPWRAEKTEVDWKRRFAEIINTASTENGVFAVKIMANQIAEVDAFLATFNILESTDETKPYPHLYDIFKDALWVYIERKDAIAQAISRAMAVSTGINHATACEEDEHFAGNLMRGFDTTYNRDTPYRFNLIHKFVNEVVVENLAWRAFFEAHEIEPLRLIYEQVAADTEQSHLNHIAERLGLLEPLDPQPRRLVKMANETSKHWYRQYFSDILAGQGR